MLRLIAPPHALVSRAPEHGQSRVLGEAWIALVHAAEEEPRAAGGRDAPGVLAVVAQACRGVSAHFVAHSGYATRNSASVADDVGCFVTTRMRAR